MRKIWNPFKTPKKQAPNEKNKTRRQNSEARKNLPSIDTILENCVMEAWQHTYIRLPRPKIIETDYLKTVIDTVGKKRKIARHCVRVPIERKKEKTIKKIVKKW